jgi:hypothetical protein
MGGGGRRGAFMRGLRLGRRCKYEGGGKRCRNEVDQKEKQGGAGRWGLREGKGFTVVILEWRCRDGGTEGKRCSYEREKLREEKVQI